MHADVVVPQPVIRREASSGFTVIELAVAMLILGVMLAMAAPAWKSYQLNQERVSASREVVSVLRGAQVRAAAEETTYRVDLDGTARTLSVYRFNGATYEPHSVSRLVGNSVLLSSAEFINKDGAATSSAYFYPRGTASPGKVVVAIAEKSKQHLITVEGLTGRVSST